MYLTLKSAIALRCHYLKCIYTVKTAILNIRIFLLKLDILAFTVVRTTTTNFKVIVHSNLVVRYFIHCGKTTISADALKFSRRTVYLPLPIKFQTFQTFHSDTAYLHYFKSLCLHYIFGYSNNLIASYHTAGIICKAQFLQTIKFPI